MGIETQVIKLPRGSDVSFELPFEDDNGVAINMTGWNIDVFEAGPDGAAETYVNDNSTVSWVNQAEGIAKFAMPWGPGIPDAFWVRLRITRTSDDHDDGIDQINVRFT